MKSKIYIEYREEKPYLTAKVERWAVRDNKIKTVQIENSFGESDYIINCIRDFDASVKVMKLWCEDELRKEKETLQLKAKIDRICEEFVPFALEGTELLEEE